MFYFFFRSEINGVYYLCSVPVELIGRTSTEQKLLGELLEINYIDENHASSADCTYSVVIGNREWMLRNGMNIDEKIEQAMSAEEEMGS